MVDFPLPGYHTYFVSYRISSWCPFYAHTGLVLGHTPHQPPQENPPNCCRMQSCLVPSGNSFGRPLSSGCSSRNSYLEEISWLQHRFAMVPHRCWCFPGLTIFGLPVRIPPSPWETFELARNDRLQIVMKSKSPFTGCLGSWGISHLLFQLKKSHHLNPPVMKANCRAECDGK